MDGVSHVVSVYGIYDPFSEAFSGYFEVDFQSYPVGQLIDFSRLTGSGVEMWPYLFFCQTALPGCCCLMMADSLVWSYY